MDWLIFNQIVAADKLFLLRPKDDQNPDKIKPGILYEYIGPTGPKHNHEDPNVFILQWVSAKPEENTVIISDLHTHIYVPDEESLRF